MMIQINNSPDQSTLDIARSTVADFGAAKAQEVRAMHKANVADYAFKGDAAGANIAMTLYSAYTVVLADHALSQ